VGHASGQLTQALEALDLLQLAADPLALGDIVGDDQPAGPARAGRPGVPRARVIRHSPSRPK